MAVNTQPKMPLEDVARHVRHLHSSGMSYDHIATKAGCSKPYVIRCAREKHPEGKMTNGDLGSRVLGVVTEDPTGRADLLRDLKVHLERVLAAGCKLETVAEIAELSESNIRAMLRGRSVSQFYILRRVLDISVKDVKAYERILSGPMTDRSEARDHLVYVQGTQQYSLEDVARDAGIPKGMVRRVTATNSSPQIPVLVSEAVLKVGRSRSDSRVSVGSIRRILALFTHGWSIETIKTVAKEFGSSSAKSVLGIVSGEVESVDQKFHSAMERTYDMLMNECTEHTKGVGASSRIMRAPTWWSPTHENMWDGDLDLEGDPVHQFDPEWMIDQLLVDLVVEGSRPWTDLNYFEKVAMVERYVNMGYTLDDVHSKFSKSKFIGIKDYYALAEQKRR